MKLIAFLVCFLCSMLLYHQTEASSYDLDIKQTLSIIKVLLKSGLSDLHLSITSLFEPTSGQIPIDGTPLIMNYFAHDCDIHVGRKRMIFTDLLSCKADVTEAVTHVSRSCEKTSQTEAVQCAIKMILEKIQSDIENTSTPSY